LLWVGEKYYSTPIAFAREGARMGFSRRLPAVPPEVKIGDYVYFAHRKCAFEDSPDPAAGLFLASPITRVDLIVDSTDPALLPSRAIAIKKRFGNDARFVKVTPAQGSLL